jgi:hypothetical protein
MSLLLFIGSVHTIPTGSTTMIFYHSASNNLPQEDLLLVKMHNKLERQDKRLFFKELLESKEHQNYQLTCKLNLMLMRLLLELWQKKMHLILSLKTTNLIEILLVTIIQTKD